MPIIRYFVFVGLLLTALLFAADRYLPASVDHAQSADLDKTIIRIRSARNLPEKIVLDTRSPAIVAPAPAADSSSREAFAAMTEATAPKTEDQKPLAQKLAQERPRAKRSAKPNRRTPERRLAFDRRDFFGGTW
jgi:hypothetical protein